PFRTNHSSARVATLSRRGWREQAETRHDRGNAPRARFAACTSVLSPESRCADQPSEPQRTLRYLPEVREGTDRDTAHAEAHRGDSDAHKRVPIDVVAARLGDRSE